MVSDAEVTGHLSESCITAVMRVETKVGRTEERAEYEDSESNQFLRLLFCSEGEQGRIVAKEWCGEIDGGNPVEKDIEYTREEQSSVFQVTGENPRHRWQDWPYSFSQQLFN